MEFNFKPILEELGPNAAFQVANQAKPASAYALARILPERPSTSYYAERGQMVVRATMAGVVAMDSPYPVGGFIEVDTFRESTLKLGIEIPLSEYALRTLQEIWLRLNANGSSSTETLVNEALNFFDKAVLQSHFDMSEYLRGQALTTGALNLTYNGKQISVDYGVPSGNLFANKTGTARYGGTASAFWADYRQAQRVLRGGVEEVIMNSETAAEIVYNPVNDITVLDAGAGFWSIQRHEKRQNANVPSADRRDVVRITLYDGEGDLLNPVTNTVAPVKFIPDGKIVIVGRSQIRGYEVGVGSTVPPDTHAAAIGYTHLAPTTESGGVPGRWGQLYVPENAPWSLRGRAASNQMPVIEAPEKLVVLSTAMA
jgi:hypothetical protein